MLLRVQTPLPKPQRGLVTLEGIVAEAAEHASNGSGADVFPEKPPARGTGILRQPFARQQQNREQFQTCRGARTRSDAEFGSTLAPNIKSGPSLLRF